MRNSNRTINKLTTLALSLGMLGSASAAVAPINATGWNHDMVINHPSPFNVSVTGTMDGGFGQAENWTWVEAGSYENPDGNLTTIPGLVAGSHSSLTGNGVFAFQPFSQNNVVGLNGGQSGTLSLVAPASYSAIALYGASGFGGKTATITLNFTDSSSTIFNVANGTGIGTDWFNNGADRAFAVGARGSNKSEEGYTRIFIQENSMISINESYFTLAAADQSKLLQSVTIQNTGGDRMAVFALSGAQVVPEPTALSLVALSGLGALFVRRKAR